MEERGSASVAVAPDAFRDLLCKQGGNVSAAAKKAGYSGSAISQCLLGGSIPLRMLQALKGTFPGADWDSLVVKPGNGVAHGPGDGSPTYLSDRMAAMEEKVDQILAILTTPPQ